MRRGGPILLVLAGLTSCSGSPPASASWPPACGTAPGVPSTWQIEYSGAADALLWTLGGSGPTDVYAGGANLLLHSSGDGTWTAIPLPVSDTVLRIWTSGPGDLWALAISDLYPAIDVVDDVIGQDIQLNLSGARTSAQEIGRRRRSEARWVIALDVLSALLAALAAVLAIRVAQSYDRLLEERGRHSEARASELELFSARVAHDLVAPLQTTQVALDLSAMEAGAAPPH